MADENSILAKTRLPVGDERSTIITSTSASTSASTSTTKKRKRNHCVHYRERCTVVLIPSRIEYIDAGIDLWYTRADFYIAMMQVQEEMDALSTESQTNASGPVYTSYNKNMLQQSEDLKFLCS